ncbi:MAG: hypothetical protein CMJ77_02125 [Planctomycetaceae bacterium]|nr:hypothetical protein [Planctomycetaceae bacterium]
MLLAIATALLPQKDRSQQAIRRVNSRVNREPPSEFRELLRLDKSQLETTRALSGPTVLRSQIRLLLRG